MVYDKKHAAAVYKDLARWVNNRFIFAKCKRFEDYKLKYKIMAKFIPTATIGKVAKGHYEVVVKKSFMAKTMKVEKRFKSQTKAIEWALINGYKVEGV